MRIASLVLASLVIGVTAETAYAQSSPMISGRHGFALFTPQIAVVSDAKRTIKYTDPTSGSTTSALLLSGHVTFRPRNSTALWSTELLVMNTNNYAIHAKSISITGSTPTAALGNAATAPSAAANGMPSAGAPRSDAAAGTDLPDCQSVQCIFSVSNGNLFVNSIQVPGNEYTGGIPGNPDAVVTVNGTDVQLTVPGVAPMTSPVIMTSPTAPITAGGGDGSGSGGSGDDGGGDDGGGDGGGGCDDVVRAAAKLLHVQPQEIHVQPEIQPKGAQPAIDMSPC
jgi:hypothetical protein